MSSLEKMLIFTISNTVVSGIGVKLTLCEPPNGEEYPGSGLAVGTVAES